MLNEDGKSKTENGDNNQKGCCRHKCCYCGKHCWLKALGAIAILALIIGLCCHHGHSHYDYHHSKSKTNQINTQ